MIRANVLLGTLLVLGACTSGSDEVETAADTAIREAPNFSVDPSWPQQLPNDWIMGSITAVFVDAQDHVWVTHLPETLTPEEISAVQEPPIGLCCRPAPVVVEFDPEGNVVQGWGIQRHRTFRSFRAMPTGCSWTTTTTYGLALIAITAL